MSEAVKKYLQNLGFKYEESKAMSNMSRKELTDKIANHPEIGKKFSRKTYEVERHMKDNKVYYI